MNVLVDRHHAGLFHSMQLLAERFGWTLYTPTGQAWWDKGYWNFGRWTWPDSRLARQYLNAAQEPDNEFPDWPINYVSLEEARQMPWAFVIATLQDNQHGFAQFARETGAQFVIQVGNTGQYVDWGLDPLVLMSSEMPILGKGVVYHQPMDPVPFMEPYPIARTWAASFVNCMPSMGGCYELLQNAQSLGLVVDVYGIDGPAGVIKPYSRSVELMAGVGWGWHDKAHGDGFGHVIHGWAQVGRPLIGHASHYAGKMAESLWVDGETCIDLDRHSVGEAVSTVLSMSPQRHREMCLAIRAKFDAIDWEGEARAIEDLLGLAVAA